MKVQSSATRYSAPMQLSRIPVVNSIRPEPLGGRTIMVRGKPTYLWAAEVVLRAHKRPLRAPEIVSYAQEQGLFSGEMHSRTPQKSMQARLSLDILNRGEQSIFVRTGRGTFYLREFLANNAVVPLHEE